MEVNDEAAERRYCRNLSKQLMARTPDEREDLLMRERAAVRAPLQAENDRLTVQLATMRSKCRSAEELTAQCVTLETKFTEAQAESERLRQQYVDACSAATVRAGSLQAEIERLKAVQTTQSLRIDLIRILAEKWKGRIYPASWAQAASELGGELRAEVLTGEPSRATSGLLTQACIKMQVKLGKLKDETEWLRQRCIALENGKDDNARSPAAGQLETNLSEAQVEIERLSKQVQELEQECGEHVSYENVLLRRAQAAEKQVQELQQEIADRDRWDDDDGRIYPEDPK